MLLSAEITMYPLQADYRPLIEAFIARLNAVADGLRIETYPTCTLITGEHDRVMDTLKDLLRWSHDTQGRAVFVAKFLPGYEAL